MMKGDSAMYALMTVFLAQYGRTDEQTEQCLETTRNRLISRKSTERRSKTTMNMSTNASFKRDVLISTEMKKTINVQ